MLSVDKDATLDEHENKKRLQCRCISIDISKCIVVTTSFNEKVLYCDNSGVVSQYRITEDYLTRESNPCFVFRNKADKLN